MLCQKKTGTLRKRKNEKIIIKFVNQDYIFAEEDNALQMKKKKLSEISTNIIDLEVN